MRDKAIGFIRQDLTKNLDADEQSVSGAAEWSDLELTEVLVADTEPSLLRVLDAINRHRAAVVIVPTAAHLQVGRALETAGVSLLVSRLIARAEARS